MKVHERPKSYHRSSEVNKRRYFRAFCRVQPFATCLAMVNILSTARNIRTAVLGIRILMSLKVMKSGSIFFHHFSPWEFEKLGSSRGHCYNSNGEGYAEVANALLMEVFQNSSRHPSSECFDM
ncbi:hypothetical protein BDW68DRAFT_159253 [Aspergillus falconensis]